MADDVDIRGLAAEIHRSYDWTLKNWRRLVDEEGLPRPFIGFQAGGRPWWSRQAVRAWKEAAGAGRLAQPIAPIARPAANQDAPSPPPAGGVRARLLAAAGGRG